jgi:TonB family protein
MIAAWMAYALLVGAFSAGAAWILEELLRSHRRPVRWVWLGGMALAAAWPIWMALRPEGEPVVSGPLPGPAFVALEPLALQVGTRSIWMALDGPLLASWILSSSVLIALGLVLLLRTRRLRKRWRGDEAVGRKVLISDDWGPAVVGLMDPQIVLPSWCRSMEEEALRLILDHEAEHLEAGDLRLLALAGAFPVLFPWSIPTWWMWHRLRLAVEGDCDLRVLKRNPQATRAYLELLLEVGRRFPQGRVAAAMLSEPERTLARRIRTMTMPIPKKPILRGFLLVAVGAILIAVACAVPTPMAQDDDSELPAVQAVMEGDAPALSESYRDLMDAPTFTPFTAPPGLQNREEVMSALEAEYPPLLKDAGIGGTANVWFFIDEAGVVRKTLINETSGHRALDEAALRVADVVRFSAARNRDEPVPVWIALPITFTVPGSEGPAREEPGDADEGQGADVIQDPNNPASPPRPAAPALLSDPGEGQPNETHQVEVARLPSGPGTEGRASEQIAESPTFTPFTVRPDITNRATIARAMEAEYPPLLRDAGIGGTANVWFFIDEAGTVQRVLLNQSSGDDALDEAALRVARQIEFTPALNRDKRVPVWISLPITFTAR